METHGEPSRGLRTGFDEESAPRSRERRKLAIVIDDNPDHRTIAAALLEYAGLDVLEADSAELGLHLIRVRRPVLALIDLQMPGVGGIDLIRQLRQDSDLDALHITVYTSFADNYYPELMDLGCTVITKPVEAAEFIEAIQTVLRDERRTRLR